MTTLGTRFRPFTSDAQEDVDATMDATMRDASRPAAVDPTSAPNVDGARYAVKSVLGRGGMGEVRLCHDSRIGRDVAIKVAHHGDTAVRARFLRESRVQGQLEHPAIVPVYDLEVFEDGSAYFAMKRVRGQTLGAILADVRRGAPDALERYPLRKLLAAFNSVCLAVEFAHAKGVVHRDIKPGNIMLGDFGEVYLLDWGLAKVVAAPDDDALAAGVSSGGAPGAAHAGAGEGETVVGSVLGTPGYMAPEQIDAARGPITPAADVYALGAVLFEILAGARYVDAEDSLEATLGTLQGRERRPSKVARPEVARDIAPALDDICERALALDPAARFASARELYEAIDGHLAGEQDLERRRALAATHLAQATRQPDTDVGRSVALQELGSALALDPENVDARRSLVRLLTTSPTTTPAEVQRRIAEDEAERVRAIARLRARTGLSIAPFFPFALWLGVIETWAVASAAVAFAVTALLSASLMRAERPSIPRQVLAHAAFLAAAVGVARIAGPFMIVPGLLVAYAVELQMHPRKGQRTGVMLACCATVVVLFGIELSGLVPPSYSVVEGGILIHSRGALLDERALWFLAAAAVVTIITPSVFAARIRGQLAEAEAKLHLQAWQLAQIVPPEGQRISASD